jgi:protoporphyrinogen/coproporphyrinogen III oxidase
MAAQKGPMRVAVLGAGITGLTAAYELLKRAASERRPVELTVLEASSRVGGKIQTEAREGAIIEAGPDSFITTKPHALELVRELGLGGELVKTNQRSTTVHVCAGGRLRALPDGMSFLPTKLLPFVLSDLLTWRGKARLLAEPWIPAEDGHQDESLGSFVRRRLGPEALDRVIGPMLAGIYAGDAEALSVLSTFPQLKEMERRGGLLRSLLKDKKPKADPDVSLFMSLRGGMSRLTEALAARLPAGAIRLSQPVQSLRRRGGEWQVQTPAGVVAVDGVISALAANHLAKAVNDCDPELAGVLAEIPFVSTATVSTVFEKKGFPATTEGFGFLVPKSEKRAITAATFSSTKFPGRASEDTVLIRAFLGGAGREGPAEADDDSQIARSARHDLRDLLGLGERHPRLTRTFRFPKANPQYNVGHGLRLKRIESCLRGHPGLALAGCSYHGVGLPDCVRSGREAAGKMLSALPAGAPAGVA